MAFIIIEYLIYTIDITLIIVEGNHNSAIGDLVIDVITNVIVLILIWVTGV